MQQRSFITVSKPPLGVFAAGSVNSQEYEDEGNALPGQLYDRTDYPEEGDMLTYYYDHPLPMKGEPYPAAVDAIQAPKKLIMGAVSFAKRHYILCGIFIALPNFITRRYWKSVLEFFFKNYVMGMIYPHFLIDKRYCRSVREIRRAGQKVINEQCGDLKDQIIPLLESFASTMQWDNAHRYRFQDITEELNKEAFAKNPSKEINRLVHIQVSRERGWHEAKGRYFVVGWAVRYLMFFKPAVKKFAIAFVNELNIEEVKLDKDDDYYNFLRPDYDIHGWPMELRQKKYLKIYNKYAKENPARLQEGHDKREQWVSFERLKQATLTEKGFVFMVFVAMRDGNKSMVKMIETQLSIDNPSLKDSVRRILDGQKKPEPLHEPKT